MLCEDCEIDCIIAYCCKSHPETGKFSELKMDDGTLRHACPSLDAEGICTEYDNRPKACIEYQCPKNQEVDLFEMITSLSRN